MRPIRPPPIRPNRKDSLTGHAPSGIPDCHVGRRLRARNAPLWWGNILLDDKPTGIIDLAQRSQEGLDVDAFLAALREIDYAGWMVVEQDIFPTTAERFARAAADQRANREFLKERGL